MDVEQIAVECRRLPQWNPSSQDRDQQFKTEQGLRRAGWLGWRGRMQFLSDGLGASAQVMDAEKPGGVWFELAGDSHRVLRRRLPRETRLGSEHEQPAGPKCHWT